MKTCRKCGEDRPSSEFSTSKKNRDGLDSFCRPCRLAYSRQYRLSHLAQMADYAKVYQANNPTFAEKTRVRRQLTNALRSGKVARSTSCETCAATNGLQAHHDDYTKPFEVRWLCRGCHMRIHRGRRAA